MDFRFAIIKRWMPVVIAMTVAAFCAQSQSLMRPGQAIIFSTSDNADVSSSTQPPAAEPPAAPGFADMIHAPEINFQNPSAAGTHLPAVVPPIVSPDQDAHANWALMTPAEILGVQTPDQVLKIPERDAAGQRKNPTAVERYYERQDQAQTNGTGEFSSATPSLRDSFSDNEDARLNAIAFKPAGDGFANPAQQQADPFQQPATGNNEVARQNADSGWSKFFIPPPTPVQSPAEAEDMAEFRKLLEPSQPPPSSKPSSGDGFFTSQQNLTSSKFGQPVNPAGAAFGSFNNIGGLPGGAGQVSVPAVPDWKPQSPPWTLKGPQPDVIPKRVVF